MKLHMSNFVDYKTKKDVQRSHLKQILNIKVWPDVALSRIIQCSFFFL